MTKKTLQTLIKTDLVELGLRVEGMRVVELLQLLVAVVDAQLLEAVDGKHLKPKDVEQAQEVVVNVGGRHGYVDPRHQHVEQPGWVVVCHCLLLYVVGWVPRKVRFGQKGHRVDLLDEQH